MSKSSDSPLRVLAVEVENILRAKAVYIEPVNKLTEVTGRNAQGKTSSINALYMGICGEKAIPPDPVRRGADAGHVTIQLGDTGGLKLKVTRKIKKRDDGSYSTSLTVENADGQRFSKPQEILNALIGQYMADPLEFMRSPAKAQFDALKGCVPGVDFDAIDAAQASDFAKRTDVNRRVKELRARASGVALPQRIPAERVDEPALVEEMQRAGERNAEIERQKSARLSAAARRDAHFKAATDKHAEAESMRARADELDRQGLAEQENVKRVQSEIDAMPPLAEAADTSTIKTKIEQARRDNAAFDEAARQQDIIADAEIAEAEAADLTAAMAAREADKKAKVAAANIPVKGITFGDGTILLNGFPLDQASGAQQLRCAVEVASALNPKLRFVRVKDASLLDADSWAELGALCEELDLQVFAETVQSGRPGAVVIEDGTVVGAAVKHLEAAE